MWRIIVAVALIVASVVTTHAETCVTPDVTPPSFETQPASLEVDCSEAVRDDDSTSTTSSDSDDISIATCGDTCPAPLETVVPSAPDVTASDACDTDVDIVLTENVLGACPGVIVRTWTATDNAANQAQAVQLVVNRKACTNNADYWSNNQSEWLSPFGPLTDFELGCPGDITDSGSTLSILQNTSSGDVTVKLAKQLISASLNVAQGADDNCAAEAIQDAKDFLCTNTIGSTPTGQVQKFGRGLTNTLKRYNAGLDCSPTCP